MTNDQQPPAASADARLRPQLVCAALLAALEASEGRRRSRKRDQTPDAIGLNAKRTLMEAVVHDDPESDAFEAWLLRYAQEAREDERATAWAMARALLDEWRLAHGMPEFAAWLAAGAPSADAHEAPRS